MTAHRVQMASDASKWMWVLLGTPSGVTKDELLSDHFAPPPGYWEQQPLVPEIAEVALSSSKHRNPRVTKGRAYGLKPLEAALSAFYRADSFREDRVPAFNPGQ